MKDHTTTSIDEELDLARGYSDTAGECLMDMNASAWALVAIAHGVVAIALMMAAQGGADATGEEQRELAVS